MPAFQNESEAFVAALCEQSFLPLWSYPNPTGKKGKELCDLLVVCGPDIAIVSVKDIQPSSTTDEATRVERWTKKALDGSFRQLAGAERWLRGETAVTDASGRRAVALFPVDERRVYRIALAFGGGGQMPLKQGDFGSGFVHAIDEQAFDTLIRELDTATDFFGYLRRKEEVMTRGSILFDGAEEDLLAFYLVSGRRFPANPDLFEIGEGLWPGLIESEEYRERDEANRVSRLWDDLIQQHIDGFARDPRPTPPTGITSATTVWEAEPALRVLAQEDRYWRRVFSESLVSFYGPEQGDGARARTMASPERGVTYVLIRARAGEDADDRNAELIARCWIARGRLPDHPVVVGIALGTQIGDPTELLLIRHPVWTEADARRAVDLDEALNGSGTLRAERKSGREFPVVLNETDDDG